MQTKNEATDTLSKIADAVVTVDDVIALWPLDPAPTAERILQWSRAGKFPKAYRPGSQKELPRFNKAEVLNYLEAEFAPMIAEPARRTTKKGGRDV